MDLESPRVGPVSLSERILFVDILRGMALFGILAANMRAFVAPLEAYGNIGVLFHSRADVLTQAFIDAFIQGKFISIFSFLFGMGFAIQMSRAEAKGVVLEFLSAPLAGAGDVRSDPRGADLGRRHPADVRRVGSDPAAVPQPATEDLAVVGGRVVHIADC